MIRIILLALSLSSLSAFAQDEPNMPQIPDEATKIRALKRAYELNGNSMVGWGRGSIDLSKEDLSETALPPVSEIPPKKGRK
jgi:hypothetical protein